MPIDAISPNRLSAAAFIIAFSPEPSRPLAKMRMRSRRCRGVCKWVPHGATFKSCSDHRGKIQSGFRFGKLGRSERIRTSGPCLPKAVLYQAELHSDAMRVTLSTLASHVVGTDAGAEAANESNQRVGATHAVSTLCVRLAVPINNSSKIAHRPHPHHAWSNSWPSLDNSFRASSCFRSRSSRYSINSGSGTKRCLPVCSKAIFPRLSSFAI